MNSTSTAIAYVICYHTASFLRAGGKLLLHDSVPFVEMVDAWLSLCAALLSWICMLLI